MLMLSVPQTPHGGVTPPRSAAFWFTAAYWCDKAELLRLSRRPITYSSDLSDMVMNLLPYAAVRHLLRLVAVYAVG